MALIDRVHGASGIKIIVGSAFLWAWLDALFMSAFFTAPDTKGLTAELAAVAVFGFSALGYAAALKQPGTVNKLIAGKRLPLIAAVLGTTGSLLLTLSGFGFGWMPLVIGSALVAAFVAVFQIGWGAAYCQDGARTATPYVAGAFACAVVIDTPMLFMIPEASAVFFSLLPLISGLIFTAVPPDQRTYRRTAESSVPAKRGARAHLKTHLGISMMLLCAAALVLTSFGYLQHLVSFSSIASNGSPGGVIVQVARGIAAILMFGIVCIAPQRASAVYRVGLLAMIAGFMMMSFLFGSELFWIAGAVIISGYTAFDLLVWVVFSQIAHTQSRDPLKTIAAVRLLAVVCYVVGALAGILLVGNDQSMHAFVFQETTAIGYLVVIATVLLLSSEDIWMLFGYTARAGSANQEGIGQEERLAAWFDRIGLTARERDIASLLAAGRTQPWIADCLSISENTVGTHVRHIYQKADVHNRQEFIDRAISPDHPASPESRDHVSNVTDVA